MPQDARPLSLIREVAELKKRLARHQTAIASGFDPNADPIRIGLRASAPGASHPIVVGVDAIADGDNSIAIGQSANTHPGSNWGVAIGNGAHIFTSVDGIAIGDSAGVFGADGGIAIGGGSSTNGANGIAVGELSSAGTTDAVAIGDAANAAHNHATAIGAGAATTKAHQVMLGTAADFVEIPGNGTANGLVLTDTVTGTRYLVQITSGALVLSTAP